MLEFRKDKVLKVYLKFLSAMYFVGFLLHFADIFDLRLKFSTMDNAWKAWIIYLMLMDLIAAIGLWKKKIFGIIFFLIVAATQLIAYLLFMDFFGKQYELILFHIITLVIFIYLSRGSRLKDL